MHVPLKKGMIRKKINPIILQSFDQRVENEKRSRYAQEQEEKKMRYETNLFSVAENLLSKRQEHYQTYLWK